MDDVEKQLSIAERLQLKLLENYEELFKADAMTATDRANLFRMLEHGGWSLDPTRAKQTVRNLLTEKVDPKEFDTKHDADVLPMKRQA